MRQAIDALPIEQFIQALTSQLDRAQATLALKARAGLPLTFAVKDLSIDLRAHFEVVDSAVHIRPAGTGDTEASRVHLTLTSITRPMIEENTVDLTPDPDQPSLQEVIGEDVTEDEVRRLEWAGIQNVTQLRALREHANESTLQKLTQIPAQRLRQALQRAGRPWIRGVARERMAPMGPGQQKTPVLRIRGENLTGKRQPLVRIGEKKIPVLRATTQELLVAPPEDHFHGTLTVEVEPGEEAAIVFDASEPTELPHEGPDQLPSKPINGKGQFLEVGSQ